ncbi:MAG: FAD-binding oxidoreductase [Albidovulum sp.]
MKRRVIILGAGVTGAAIAYRLAKAGASVAVIDAATPGAGASGRSFGWINANFYADEDHFRLRMAGIAAYHRLTRDLGPGGVTWPGSLSWEEAGAAQEATAAALDALGYPVRRVGPAEFAKMEPAIAARPESALYFPSEGVADPGDLARRFLEAASGLGAQFYFGLQATRLDLTGGAVTGVHTAMGKIAAHQVVVAAGTGSAALLSEVGVGLPMKYSPALILSTNPVAPMISRVLASPMLEIRQRADGRLLVPATAGHQRPDAPEMTTGPMEQADAALAYLRALLPTADLRWERVMRAERPIPKDGLPVVGATSVPGLSVAVMHSGATLGPLIGELLADEVMGGPASALLAPYRPGRFA